MAQTSIAPRNILVVDDEADICDTLKMLLMLDGHEVATASSGPEALDLFSQRRFDLVITDYLMHPMKGDELATAIKSRNPAQPIVMITAHVEVLTGTKPPLNGVDALVSKPFGLAQLREVIAKVLA